jgi:hypothetical protein
MAIALRFHPVRIAFHLMRTTLRAILLPLLGAVAAAIVAGCSAKVHDETSAVLAAPAPDMVYIGTFDLGAAAVQQDPGTLTGRPRLLQIWPEETPVEELQHLGDLLVDDLANDLNDKGMPAQRLAPGASQPRAGWLVTGEFLQVEGGNRLQRAVIGFGAGSSDAQLYVAVADLAHPQGAKLFQFNADSTGDKTPGGSLAAVGGHSIWGMVGKFVIEKNASEKDIKSLAKAIAREIAKHAGTP